MGTKKMTKKATKKQAKTKPGQPRRDVVDWIVRTSPDLRQWCTDQAKDLGISRDAFMRLLLEGSKAQTDSLESMRSKGLFDEVESQLEQKLEQILAGHLDKVNRLQATKRGEIYRK